MSHSTETNFKLICQFYWIYEYFDFFSCIRTKDIAIQFRQLFICCPVQRFIFDCSLRFKIRCLQYECWIICISHRGALWKMENNEKTMCESQFACLFKDVWHVNSQTKVWSNQNFITSRYNKNLKKSPIPKMSRTFILYNNNAETLLTYWQKKVFNK